MASHYSPPGDADPADFARELATVEWPELDASELGWVYVVAVEKHEDYWSAAWVRGKEHWDMNGPQATVMAWAKAQPASHYRVIDDMTGRWVPMPSSDDGDEESGGMAPA